MFPYASAVISKIKNRNSRKREQVYFERKGKTKGKHKNDAKGVVKMSSMSTRKDKAVRHSAYSALVIALQNNKNNKSDFAYKRQASAIGQ